MGDRHYYHAGGRDFHPQPADLAVPVHRPPTIGIRAQYPGASAQTVQDTVTQVIEQNMNGLDYLLYMSSTSDSSGQAKSP